MILISFGVFYYSLCMDIYNNRILLVKSFSYFKIFIIMSLLCIIVSFFPLLPVTGWFFPVIFALLTVEMGIISGIVGSNILLLIAVNFSEVRFGIFVLFFLSGVISALLISDIIKTGRKNIYLILNTIFDLIILAAMILFYLSININAEAFIIPIVNIFVCTLLLYVISTFFLVKYVDFEKNTYLNINDQTNELLKELKNVNNLEYLKAIHSTHYIRIICNACESDKYLCLGGGYYYSINEFKEYFNEYKDCSTVDIMEKNNFPEEMQELLLNICKIDSSMPDFNDINIFCVFVSRNIVEKIMDKGFNIDDYDSIINSYFDELYNKKCLQKLDITFSTYNKIKEVVLNEKKYARLI